MKGLWTSHWGFEALLPSLSLFCHCIASRTQTHCTRRSQNCLDLHSSRMAFGGKRGFDERTFRWFAETGILGSQTSLHCYTPLCPVHRFIKAFIRQYRAIQWQPGQHRRGSCNTVRRWLYYGISRVFIVANVRLRSLFNPSHAFVFISLNLVFIFSDPYTGFL